MEKLKFSEVVEAVHGSVNGTSQYDRYIDSVVTDSRKCREGSLFVAIKGENVDGNDFVDKAFSGGACAALTTRKTDDEREIRVEDSVLALGNLARHYFKKLSLPLVAVTGSSGKTTTKDMMYYALSLQVKVHRTQGNYNNEIGLPLTVLEADGTAEYMVLEMGMSQEGEIDYLCGIAKPDVAIITNIGTAHMEQLGSREAIFRAKMEIAHRMDEKGLLLLNADDDFLSNADRNTLSCTVKTFGFSENADYRCLSYEQEVLSMKVRALIGEKNVEYRVPLGLHNISNSLAVLGAIEGMGLDLKKAVEGLEAFRPSDLRMDVREYGKITVINDSYNANPDSMKSVLSIFKTDPSSRRKIAVLGDMLELGENSRLYHEEVGRYAFECCDSLLCFGEYASFMAEAAVLAGMKREAVFFSNDKQEVAKNLKELLEEGDLVLIKGSRGMKMEELLSVFGGEER